MFAADCCQLQLQRNQASLERIVPVFFASIRPAFLATQVTTALSCLHCSPTASVESDVDLTAVAILVSSVADSEQRDAVLVLKHASDKQIKIIKQVL